MDNAINLIINDLGADSLIPILLVYLLTDRFKIFLRANVKHDCIKKERCRKLFIIIFLPLIISIIVTLLFFVFEISAFSVQQYLKDVFINWGFSGLVHKIINSYKHK